MILSVAGKDVDRLDPHSGGYRIQRVPPTEKKNRTHTSTVTVAILDPDTGITTDNLLCLREDDFRIEWFSGTGAGGQKRNKVQSSCRVIHIPTGITESRQSRSREGNYLDAKLAITKRLEDMLKSASHSKMAKEKRSKLGTGMRGDKIVTLQFQNDRVTHHITGKTCRCKDFLSGKMSLVW